MWGRSTWERGVEEERRRVMLSVDMVEVGKQASEIVLEVS